jgi:hypothetical protein
MGASEAEETLVLTVEYLSAKRRGADQDSFADGRDDLTLTILRRLDIKEPKIPFRRRVRSEGIQAVMSPRDASSMLHQSIIVTVSRKVSGAVT